MGRRKKTAENTAPDNKPAGKSNVTPELVAEFTGILERLEAEQDDLQEQVNEVRGSYRATMKQAKSLGIDTDALALVLRLRKREPDDVTAEFTQVNRYLRWLRVPVGTQLGLWDDGKTVATKIDDDSFESDPPKPADPVAAAAKAYDAGYAVGAKGTQFQNPFPEGDRRHDHYRDGYNDAQAEIASRMGDGNQEAA